MSSSMQIISALRVPKSKRNSELIILLSQLIKCSISTFFISISFINFHHLSSVHIIYIFWLFVQCFFVRVGITYEGILRNFTSFPIITLMMSASIPSNRSLEMADPAEPYGRTFALLPYSTCTFYNRIVCNALSHSLVSFLAPSGYAGTLGRMVKHIHPRSYPE